MPDLGLAGLLLVLPLTAVLGYAGGGIDQRGIFDPDPGPGHVRTFPATLPLAWAVALVAYLLPVEIQPPAEIRRRSVRLLVANATVIACGWLTYLALRHLAGLELGTIVAVGGAAITAALLVGMLFEGWPATKLSPLPGRLLKFAGIGVLGAGVILHVAIGRRWPFAREPREHAGEVGAP